MSQNEPMEHLAAMMARNDALLDAETEMIDREATRKNEDATDEEVKRCTR